MKDEPKKVRASMWPTLAGRLNQPLTSRREALEQLSRCPGVEMSDSARKELEQMRAKDPMPVLRKAPPDFEAQFEEEAKLLTSEELRAVQQKLESLLEEKDRLLMAQTLTREQLLKLYHSRGYSPKEGDLFYKIRTSGKGRGMYGWQVGQYEHSCHIDTTDIRVLLVIEPGPKGSTYVVDVSDLWLEGPIIV